MAEAWWPEHGQVRQPPKDKHCEDGKWNDCYSHDYADQRRPAEVHAAPPPPPAQKSAAASCHAS